MANELVVRIIGDASSLNRAMSQASRNTKKFDKDISHTFRGVVAGSGAFRSLGRSVAFASAGFLGGVGLTALVRGAFEEMSNVQKAAAQTNAVLKSTGGVAGVTAEHVDELAKSLLNISGVDDEVIKNSENILLTFTNLRRVAGQGNDIFDRAAKSALNLSVRFGKDLTTASVQLGRALQDPERGLTALSRSGVSFSTKQRKVIKTLVESGHILEAQKLILREVEKETAGAAAAAGDTLAGKFNILKETIRNVGGELALQLLPALTKVVDRMLAWVQNTENQRRILDAFKQVIGAVSAVLGGIRKAFEVLNTISGSTKNTLKILFGVLVAYKTLGIVGSLAGIATQIGLIGTRATTASGEVVALKGALAGLSGIGPIAIAVALVIGVEQTAAYKQFHKDSERFFGKGGFNPLHNIQDQFRSFAGTTNKLLHQLGLLKTKAAEVLGPAGALGPTGPLPPAGALGPVGRRGAEDPGVEAARAAARAAEKAARERAKAARARIRQANEAARDAALERADLAVARAQATKTLTDDLVALRKENALIARRIRGGHDTIALQRQQLDVQNQITSVLQQQAEARKAQEEARAEAKSTRQFRRLGLGPGGEELVPGVNNLKRQLSSVTDAIEGSFLDTKKTRQRLRSIRAVLAAGVGNIAKDVRATIKQMIDDLNEKLKNASVDVTRFNKTASGQFVLAGAHGAGSHDIVVQGGIHLHGIQNVQQLENALAKRQKQRGRQRRSTR